MTCRSPARARKWCCRRVDDLRDDIVWLWCLRLATDALCDPKKAVIMADALFEAYEERFKDPGARTDTGEANQPKSENDPSPSE